jgi:hypothetical protein
VVAQQDFAEGLNLRGLARIESHRPDEVAELLAREGHDGGGGVRDREKAPTDRGGDLIERAQRQNAAHEHPVGIALVLRHEGEDGRLPGGEIRFEATERRLDVEGARARQGAAVASSSAMNSASVRTVTPASCAFCSLLPALPSLPTTR